MNLYQHPSFKKLDSLWQEYQDYYEGDRDTMLSSKYLVRHLLEQSDKEGSRKLLNTRLKRTQYTNHISKIFIRYLGILFSKPASLDDEVTALFDEFGLTENIGGCNNSLDEFLKTEIFKSKFLYGRIFLLTDAPALKAETVAERKAQGIRPFWRTLNPRSVKDWNFKGTGSSIGSINWLRHEYLELAERESETDAPTEKLYCKSYKYEDGKILVKKYLAEEETKGEIDWKFVEELLIKDLIELPIAYSLKGESYIKEVIAETSTFHNLQSNKLNHILHQGHADKYIIGDLTEELQTAQGEYVTKFLPQGSTVEVIEPSYPQALIEECDKAEARVYKAAFNLTRILPSDSKSVEGADTQDKSRQDLITALKSEVESIEDVLNQGIRHLAAFCTGDTDFQGKVSLNKNIQIEDFEKALQIELAYMEDINKVPVWKKAILKKRAEEMNLANQDEIMEEIENNDFQDANPIKQGISGLLNNG